jgi:predicted RNase H-like HicB family nuclease
MVEIEVMLVKDENYGAYSPEYNGCVATGDSEKEVFDNFKSAFKLHLQGMKEDGEVVPNEYKLIFNKSW